MDSTAPRATGRPASLRERDGGLVENWYIACLSEELRSGEPLARTLYDTHLVLFRDASGTPACFVDRCLHRHAQLSKGVVIAGNLCCPYHGWVYDRGGRVVEVPSEGPLAAKARRAACAAAAGNTSACLPSVGTGVTFGAGAAVGASGKSLRGFPMVEQDGAVWVWMGEGAPRTEAPPYRFPHRGEPGWHHYFMITDFANEATHLVENFMDVPHTVFVHAGWFRDPARIEVPIRIDTGGGRVLVTYSQENDSIGFTGRVLNPRGEPMVHTDMFVMPNITRVDYSFGGRNGFVISSQISPLTTLSSRVYTWIAYRLPTFGPAALALKPFFKFYTRRVIEQDVEIMANQGGSFARDMRTDFQHTDADDVHRAIESLRAYGATGDARWSTHEESVERVIHI